MNGKPKGPEPKPEETGLTLRKRRRGCREHVPVKDRLNIVSWTDIAIALSVSVNQAKSMHRMHPMPIWRLVPGGQPMVRPADLDRWLEECRDTHGPGGRPRRWAGQHGLSGLAPVERGGCTEASRYASRSGGGVRPPRCHQSVARCAAAPRPHRDRTARRRARVAPVRYNPPEERGGIEMRSLRRIGTAVTGVCLLASGFGSVAGCGSDSASPSVTKVPGAEGGACRTTGPACDDGLVCHSMTCVRPGGWDATEFGQDDDGVAVPEAGPDVPAVEVHDDGVVAPDGVDAMDPGPDVIPDSLDVTPDGPCVPSCVGKDCGEDGCGGDCGDCENAYGRPFCGPKGACSRFDTRPDGTIVDSKTLLMWGKERSEYCPMQNVCAKSVEATYEDWREPTPKEAATLISGCDEPCDDPGSTECSFRPCPKGEGPGPNGCYIFEEMFAESCPVFSFVVYRPSPWVIDLDFTVGQFDQASPSPYWCTNRCVRAAFP